MPAITAAALATRHMPTTDPLLTEAHMAYAAGAEEARAMSMPEALDRLANGSDGPSPANRVALSLDALERRASEAAYAVRVDSNSASEMGMALDELVAHAQEARRMAEDAGLSDGSRRKRRSALDDDLLDALGEEERHRNGRDTEFGRPFFRDDRAARGRS